MHPLAQRHNAGDVFLAVDHGKAFAILLVSVTAVCLDKLPCLTVQELEVIILRFSITKSECCVSCPQKLLTTQPRALDEAIPPMRSVMAVVSLRVPSPLPSFATIRHGQLQIWPVNDSIRALTGREPGEHAAISEFDGQVTRTSQFQHAPTWPILDL
eukprot:CAMPEP_0197667480 /NCGR_PEP_ID=MMETSP1338-20131121/66568_1 /TAXON_ID=43686 ORGANISM="Pelagodinium beii, Strain RCC1491" /NCGR_SAMPLE_ID=MMETSP1338 /ASSEMBLY_ACC=CAM_ASM_000754 /LENGTH=156 /DNA_ID=CAMNT_0043246727 /DNA_START=87 /DNA_END=557 /DNA_ORIENTATION=+